VRCRECYSRAKSIGYCKGGDRGAFDLGVVRARQALADIETKKSRLSIPGGIVR
jgi:hypothetical protein